jgi:GT2 family glycosyltransferase
LEGSLRKIQSGMSVDILTQLFAGSEEFKNRHGVESSVNAKFLTDLYRDSLARKPAPAELDGWLRLARKGITRSEALTAFAGSKEALSRAVGFEKNGIPDDARSQNLLICALYRTAFSRLVDPGGLENCLSQIRQGVSLIKLAEGLVGSPEFHGRCGKSEQIDVRLITDLYLGAFNCQPDFEALLYWLNSGWKGTTRAQMLVSLARSADDPARLSSISRSDSEKYDRWIRNCDTIGEVDRNAIRLHIAALPFRPVISIVLEVTGASDLLFRCSIDSIKAQLYPDWELCVALDASTKPYWDELVREQAAKDSRIKLIRLDGYVDYAEITNAAIRIATGEFVGRFQVGDILAEQALYEIVYALGAETSTDIVYSDCDEIDESGHRLNPWFKPGWDPDLLLALNYFDHLTFYRRRLMEELGYISPGFEGAEFHDLALRAAAATTPNRICHVPAILCHCRKRSTPGSDNGSRSSPITASIRVVRRYLDAIGYAGARLGPEPGKPDAIRIRWPIPDPPPRVSIIIPTRDRADLLKQCVAGVLDRTEYANFEILIVDNDSRDPETLELMASLAETEPQIRILSSPGPFNYSALNNYAAREATGEILLLLNNDTEVIEPGWMLELVSNVIRPDVGIVGAKLIYPNETIQHAGVVLGPNGRAQHFYNLADRYYSGYRGELTLRRTLSAVTGACLAIRKAVFFEVGGLDEINLPVAFNDVDLCLKVGQFGYRVVWTPLAELIHLESASRGLDVTPEKRKRSMKEHSHLMESWGSLLNSDPFHNPNTLFADGNPEIPSRPRRRKPWYFIIDQIPNLNKIAALAHNDCV